MEKITASEVNNLRKISGAGIMDCKNALVEANGNVDTAIELLRKKGQKVAAKRADRESSEGAAIAKVNSDSTNGVIISLNCETDFVAKNESFISLANELAKLALNHETMDEFLNSSIDSMTVNEKLIQQTGVIGEKLVIGSFEKISASYVGNYIHAGNKIATIVGFSSSVEGVEEAAKNVAMQAAAMNPIALDEKGVDQKIIDKEIEIAKDQLRQQGKPEAMLENISKGKLKRFFKDNTLINQDYIKDNKQSVSSYVKSINSDLKITDFRRVALV
ncbi:translation elongation factor Ts [Flavobacteriaceae bacterium]|nr:translation elongation factor Ts [Flavobacteriaceae bacterium]